MALTDDLGYKIGGAVPVWVAAVGLSGGYILYDRQKKKKTSAALAASASAVSAINTPSSSMDPYAGIDPVTGMPYGQEYSQEQAWQNSPIGQYLGNDPTNAAYPVGITPSGMSPGGLAAPISNPQWAEVAQNYLISKGSEPTAVLKAIQDFINGNPLSAEEQALVNLAAGQLGSPPQPLTPNLAGTSPASPVPTSNPVPATNSHTIPGFIYLSLPGEGSAYAQSGRTVYILPPGAPLIPSALIPWIQGGKALFNPPGGSAQYIQG